MNTNNAEKIGQRIKEKIAEAGVSVHGLEKKAGLKQSAIQNILYGKSKKPSLHIMQAIAQALNCSVLELLEEEPSHHPSDEPQKQPAPLIKDNNWNVELYIDVLNTLNILSKKKHIFLTKEKMFDCAEEIYEYSFKQKRNKPDKNFAEWLIEKNIKT